MKFMAYLFIVAALSFSSITYSEEQVVNDNTKLLLTHYSEAILSARIVSMCLEQVIDTKIVVVNKRECLAEINSQLSSLSDIKGLDGYKQRLHNYINKNQLI